MRWTVHGERSLYDSEWMSLAMVDVELPSGARFEHHVLRMPAHAAGVVVDDRERGVLLLWRHRFITDSWGYEIPAGRVDPGEKPIDAAAREVEEETGWRPGPLTPLTRYHPSNGSSNQTFHVFQSSDATYLGDPTDPNEAERIEWVAPSRLPGLIADGQVTDGFSLTAISTAFLLGRLS